MSGPYREEFKFEIARGPRAVAELRRAAHPWPIGWDVVVAIALVTVVIAIGRGGWREPTAFALPAGLLLVAWTTARRARQAALVAPPAGRITTGRLDDDGVRIEASTGSFSHWSWDRISAVRRTPTALALFTDAERGMVVLAETTPSFDRLAQFAIARVRSPWRSPGRWMVVVLMAYLALAALALRPRTFVTAYERVDDALDRRVDPSSDDVYALADGTLCERAALARLLSDYRRTDLTPGYAWADERATVLAAADLDRCDDGGLTPRGRVMIDDGGLGACSYFVYAVRGEARWALVGPYCERGEDPWTHTTEGAFNLAGAMSLAVSMHERVVGRRPSSSARFDVFVRDPEQ